MVDVVFSGMICGCAKELIKGNCGLKAYKGGKENDRVGRDVSCSKTLGEEKLAEARSSECTIAMKI